jgi:hypothetical protein
MGHVKKEEPMGTIAKGYSVRFAISIFRYFGVRSVRLLAGSQPPDWWVNLTT